MTFYLRRSQSTTSAAKMHLSDTTLDSSNKIHNLLESYADPEPGFVPQHDKAHVWLPPGKGRTR